MSDAALFAAVLVAFVLLRIVAATVFFFFVLPDGDRCPMCDAHTIRVVSKGWNTLMPWFRTSWCYECRWEGLHRLPRRQRSSVIPSNLSHPGQFPVSSKKSSK